MTAELDVDIDQDGGIKRKECLIFYSKDEFAGALLRGIICDPADKPTR